MNIDSARTTPRSHRRRTAARALAAVVGLLAISLSTAHSVVQASASEPQARSALAAAQKRWPNARPILSTARFGPGEYLVPASNGHFDHIALRVRSTRLSHSPTKSGSGSRATLRSAGYCYGCVYGVTARVSLDSFLWGHQQMDTYNGVSYGRYAWNISNSPWCYGAGSCQQPVYGAIGNHTATVNPWANIIVNYWGCCTRTAFLRVYVNKWNQVSGWAVMH